jgi:hypothetical protein
MGDVSSLVGELALAIQSFEGYYAPGANPKYPSGTLAWRNNNPGNLRPGSLAVGATGSSGGYAVFPDYATGLAALTGLIQSPAYYGLTLNQFFAKYAPAADNNNPGQYAATVAANLGVDPNTPISVLDSQTSAAASSSSSSSDTSGGDWDFSALNSSGDSTGLPSPGAVLDTSGDGGDGSISGGIGGLSPLALGAAAVLGLLVVWAVT